VPSRLADAPNGLVLIGDELRLKSEAQMPSGRSVICTTSFGFSPVDAEDQRDTIVTPVTILIRG
jgi:hypothetical protein